MPVILSTGDVFTFELGSGVVLSETSALMITKQDSRMGPKLHLGEIPKDAFPAKLDSIRFESRMAIMGALTAIHVPIPEMDEE